ncbi:MAG: hypothetical protein V3S46_04585 [Nitrospinota bacterium]
MDVGKINRLTGSLIKSRQTKNTGSLKKNEIENRLDKVDISTDAGKKNALELAQKAITDFRSSLIDTISGGRGDRKNEFLYNLVGTPVNDFITNRFSKLDAETKSDFMSMFSDLKNTSGGLAPQNLISQTFGSSSGFGKMIEQIGESLNRYL